MINIYNKGKNKLMKNLNGNKNMFHRLLSHPINFKNSKERVNKDKIVNFLNFINRQI